MDAFEFVKEKRRMCNTIAKCSLCALGRYDCTVGAYSGNNENDEKVIAEVEKWSKEHPLKTNQTEFLKVFPNAPFVGGFLTICPCHTDSNFVCSGGECDECKKAYWGKAVE